MPRSPRRRARSLSTRWLPTSPPKCGAAIRTSSAPAGDPSAINEQWEQIKASEKQRTSVIDGLPSSLPALLYADKVVDRLGRAGHAFVPNTERDVGDRLLGVVAEAHATGVDPEQALREAVRRLVEDSSAARGVEAGRPERPPIDRTGDSGPGPGLG